MGPNVTGKSFKYCCEARKGIKKEAKNDLQEYQKPSYFILDVDDSIFKAAKLINHPMLSSWSVMNSYH